MNFFYDRSCGWVEEVGFLLYIEDQAFACVVLGKGFHDQSAMQKEVNIKKKRKKKKNMGKRIEGMHN